jgi:hypothetical protein
MPWGVPSRALALTWEGGWTGQPSSPSGGTWVMRWTPALRGVSSTPRVWRVHLIARILVAGGTWTPADRRSQPRWLAQAHPSPRCAERTALFDRLVGEARKERRDRQRSLHTAARMRRGTRSLSRVARALKRLSASHPSWESWLYLRWRGAATAANREGTFCPADRQLRIPCARMNHDCF